MFGRNNGSHSLAGLGSAMDSRKEAEKIAQMDSAKEDSEQTAQDFIDDKLEEYEAHSLLTRLIKKILSVNGKNKANLADILMSELDIDIDGVCEADMDSAIDTQLDAISDDIMEALSDKIISLLEYLGVSKSTIDDLLDDDEDVSTAELIDLADMLNEKIGDQDLGKFITKAMNSADMDSIDMDNTFFLSHGECKSNLGKTGLTCKEGFGREVKDGDTRGRGKAEKGWWRRPKKIVNGKNPKADPEKSSASKSNSKLHTASRLAKAKRTDSMKAWWGSSFGNARKKALSGKKSATNAKKSKESQL